jgi:hypothetical protein
MSVPMGRNGAYPRLQTWMPACAGMTIKSASSYAPALGRAEAALCQRPILPQP